MLFSFESERTSSRLENDMRYVTTIIFLKCVSNACVWVCYTLNLLIDSSVQWICIYCFLHISHREMLPKLLYDVLHLLTHLHSERPNEAWQFWKYFTYKSILVKSPEREMLIRSQTKTLLQIFCELSLYSQVIIKSMRVADDTF